MVHQVFHIYTTFELRMAFHLKVMAHILSKHYAALIFNLWT